MGQAYRAIALVSVMGAGLVLAGACDDPTGPPFSFTEPVALVRLVGQMGADAVGRVHVIGLESHKFLGSSARIGEAFSGAGLSADRKTLHMSGDGCCDGWKSSQLVAMDARSLEVLWIEPLADSAGYRTDRFDGMAVQAHHQLVVDPVANRLFTPGSTEDGDGIAVLDLEPLAPAGFLGPYEPGFELAWIPPGPFSTNGAVLVFTADPDSWSSRAGARGYMHDPVTLDVIDSLDLSGVLEGETDRVAAAAAGGDGRFLYLWTASGWLGKYDLASRSVSARAAVGFGCLGLHCMSVAPDGRVYLVSGYTTDVPSSGRIAVVDPDLQPLPDVDLSGVDLSGRPPALNTVAFAPDGTLLIGAGTVYPMLWGSQAARLFFVDPDSREILGSVRIAGDAAASQILVP